MMILVPEAWMALMMFSMSCVDAGSRLAVGSSRNNTSGPSAQARASASRCCSPPDSTRAARSACCARPTTSNTSMARNSDWLRDFPASFRPYITLASAERRSITGRWTTIACCRRTSTFFPPFMAPCQTMRPLVGVSKPWHSRINTLLPAPLGPRITVRGPASMRAEMPRMIAALPAEKVSSCSSSGSMAQP